MDRVVILSEDLIIIQIAIVGKVSFFHLSMFQKTSPKNCYLRKKLSLHRIWKFSKTVTLSLIQFIIASAVVAQLSCVRVPLSGSFSCPISGSFPDLRLIFKRIIRKFVHVFCCDYRFRNNNRLQLARSKGGYNWLTEMTRHDSKTGTRKAPKSSLVSVSELSYHG